jgi:hypothetical protein
MLGGPSFDLDLPLAFGGNQFGPCHESPSHVR